MKEINLTYICKDGKMYIPFDEHIEILESYKVDAERLNNDIKELLKENSNKEKVIIAQDNIIKEVRNQLDYLETYSSKEDVFEDMKRRLDRIDKIIGSDKE